MDNKTTALDCDLPTFSERRKPLTDWTHRDSLYAALALVREEQAAYLRGQNVFDPEVQRASMIADRVLIRLKEQIDAINDRLDSSQADYYVPSRMERVGRERQ